VPEVNIDLSRHCARSFEDLETTMSSWSSLSPEAQHRAVELTRNRACAREYWPTLDPSIIDGSRAVQLDARTLRDDLLARLHERFPPRGAPAVG
jgi:hypothetical protein